MTPTFEAHTKDCPNECGSMNLKKHKAKGSFRGIDTEYHSERYVCEQCGLETSTLEQAAAAQKALSEGYKKATGLMTGEELVNRRKELGLSQEALARLLNIGVASIKRWESGLIQTKSMDRLLRETLDKNKPSGDVSRGNRDLSLPRIKRVLKCFERRLNRVLLPQKMLYGAKYLWYADMLAFRELGQGMTGACYAALPQGPQLDNYRELAPVIIEAHENESEPLTKEEERIIARVAAAFPKDKQVYDAAHNESIWSHTPTGHHIKYSDAEKLQAV